MLNQRIDRKSVKSGHLELEDFKEAFLERYFPNEKREVKIEELINLRQGNMSVEENSLKFILLSKYALPFVSNPRKEMSRFVTAVSDIVKKKCCTTMLHGDMTLSRLMVYSQSIEESNHGG